MVSLADIDLLPLQSSLKYSRDRKGQLLVLDPVRRKFIRATPEEIVRQLWILYFLNIPKVNIKLISVERAFNINGLLRRFDLVIFDRSTHPILLAEFKAPDIKINQSTFDQIAHYNMQLQVPYSLISNGDKHYCFQIDDAEKSFIWQKAFPESLTLNHLKGT